MAIPPTRTGRVPVLALLALLLAVAPLPRGARPVAAAATFTVTTTGDNPDVNPGDGVCDASTGPGAPCSLRAAIGEANATDAADRIEFAIAGGGLKTIKPNSSLPFVTRPVTIDGYTQPGASVNTATAGTNAVLRIELDGSNAGASTNGLVIQASSSVVRGLVINRFDGTGVLVHGAGATGVRVAGCFIGTAAGGTAVLPNAGTGVGVIGSAGATVGGAAPAARNLLSGNALDGVGVINGATGARVLGNLIGTTKTGAGNLGNGAFGLLISGASTTVVGGAAGAANVIAFNGADGVAVTEGFGKAALGNEIGRNSIFANGGLGIDLGDDGPTANDADDPDGGPNRFQNKPALTGAAPTAVTGTLNSVPSAAFVVRVYSNPSGDEGRVFRGQLNVVTDAGGDTAFTFTPAQPIPAGQTVTATATSDGGDTSEFSVARVVS